VAHGDVRLSLLQGDFAYRDLGLLDRTHIRFFTLETIRELLRDAGLLVVDTKRVIVPLFGSELEVKREGVRQSTVDDILADPEAESYQFVMKSVRDNGTQAVAALAERVAELTDQIDHENVQSTILRHDLRESSAANDALREQVSKLVRHIDALDGHVSGLEQLIAQLNQALAESEERHRALLATKSFRMIAPMRRLYGILRSPGSRAPKAS
jgi:predicted RNase H-like nuclease (RuvC/YqgF family)